MTAFGRDRISVGQGLGGLIDGGEGQLPSRSGRSLNADGYSSQAGCTPTCWPGAPAIRSSRMGASLKAHSSRVGFSNRVNSAIRRQDATPCDFLAPSAP